MLFLRRENMLCRNWYKYWDFVFEYRARSLRFPLIQIRKKTTIGLVRVLTTRLPPINIISNNSKSAKTLEEHDIKKDGEF